MYRAMNRQEVEKNLERRSLRVVTMEETPLNNIPVSRIKFTGAMATL